MLGTALATPSAQPHLHSTAGLWPDCDTGSGEGRCLPAIEAGFRYGEANHPGPYGQVALTCSNPGGFRGKEDLALSLGPGIHCFSETQLSAVTQPQFGRAVQWRARDFQRQVRAHFGHPAPLRPQSSWAGSWTGVATISDFPSHGISIPIPPDIWESGRVMVTTHRIDAHDVLVATIYGFPRGPTWPQAKALNNELLSYLTTNIVVGYSGMAAIVGDFNFDPMELTQHEVWSAHGWINAQTMAQQQWGQEPSPTCQGATERDQIWLSPALASLCRGVTVSDTFADHSTVAVLLELTESPSTFLTWARPSPLQWDLIGDQAWCQQPWNLQYN